MAGEFRKRELKNGKFIVSHTVDDSHDRCRLDLYLKSLYNHFSRNQIQQLIGCGRIQISKKIPKPSRLLEAGEIVQVITEQTEEPCVDFNYRVIFEDDEILVLDKPGNLPVHPAGRFLFHTLLMQLRKERMEWIEAGHDFHIIHRLDRETSGLLVLAKNSTSAGGLVAQFRERKTEKKYLALVQGNPPEDRWIIDADLGSDLNSKVRLKMAAFPKGQGEFAATTEVRWISKHQTAIGIIHLLECKPITGRQHQIRVHLAHCGFPILGDKLYGHLEQEFLDFEEYRKLKSNAKSFLKKPSQGQNLEGILERHALHSHYLKFQHPKTKDALEFQIGLPLDFQRLLGIFS